MKTPEEIHEIDGATIGPVMDAEALLHRTIAAYEVLVAACRASHEAHDEREPRSSGGEVGDDIAHSEYVIAFVRLEMLRAVLTARSPMMRAAEERARESATT